MNLSIFLQRFSLVILAIAIAFSPRFSFGTIENGKVLDIRLEDVIILFWLLCSFMYFLLRKSPSFGTPPFLRLMVGLLCTGLLSTLYSLLVGNISLSGGVFYVLKEVEYFLIYTYTYTHLTTLNDIKFIIKTWAILAFLNALWIVIEIITGLQISYYYGPNAIAEPLGPSPSGGFFLIMAMFLFNIFLFAYRGKFAIDKIIIVGLMVFPLIGIISAGARSPFFAMIIALLATFLLYLYKQYLAGNTWLALRAISFSLIGLACAIILLPSIPGTQRIFNPQKYEYEFGIDNSSSRLYIWLDQLKSLARHPQYLFFGYGKSYILNNEQTHNQYLQNLVDTGIIGSAVFFILIFSILKKGFRVFQRVRDNFCVALSAGLIVSTIALLTMSLGFEAFRVAKIAETYWFFVAISMATFAIYNSRLLNTRAR